MPPRNSNKVKVYVRTRPTNNFASEMIAIGRDNRVSVFKKPSRRLCFVYAACFSRSSQWVSIERRPRVLLTIKSTTGHFISTEFWIMSVKKKFSMQWAKMSSIEPSMATTVCSHEGFEQETSSDDHFSFRNDLVLRSNGCGKDAHHDRLCWELSKSWNHSTYSSTSLSRNQCSTRILLFCPVSNCRHLASKEPLGSLFSIAYLEIYNDIMCDLLRTLDTASDYQQQQQQQLSIGEDSGLVYVKGLSYRIANSEEEALNLLFEGETNRAIGQHVLNKQSSRSHCIFTILIECRSMMSAEDKYTISKLNLVDLAGSERLAKTNVKKGFFCPSFTITLLSILVRRRDETRSDIYQQVTFVSRTSGDESLGQEDEYRSFSELQIDACIEGQYRWTM